MAKIKLFISNEFVLIFILNLPKTLFCSLLSVDIKLLNKQYFSLLNFLFTFKFFLHFQFLSLKRLSHIFALNILYVNVIL